MASALGFGSHVGAIADETMTTTPPRNIVLIVAYLSPTLRTPHIFDMGCVAHSPYQFDADMYCRRPRGPWGVTSTEEVVRAAGMTWSFTFHLWALR